MLRGICQILPLQETKTIPNALDKLQSGSTSGELNSLLPKENFIKGGNGKVIISNDEDGSFCKQRHGNFDRRKEKSGCLHLE
jgi:hypothetical protein